MLEVTCLETYADETSCDCEVGIAALVMYAYYITAQFCNDA